MTRINQLPAAVAPISADDLLEGERADGTSQKWTVAQLLNGSGAGVAQFCLVGLSSQAVGNASNTTVTYPELRGGQDWRSGTNQALVVPEAGTYLITSYLEYVTGFPASDSRVRNQIAAGGLIYAADTVSGAEAHVGGSSKTIVARLDAGGAIGVTAWQASGSANTLGPRTHLLAVRLDSAGGTVGTGLPPGWKIQTGKLSVRIADNSQADITFDEPFESTPHIVATVNGSGQNWTTWTGGDSPTGFTLFIARVDATGTVDRSCSWIAIGPVASGGAGQPAIDYQARTESITTDSSGNVAVTFPRAFAAVPVIGSLDLVGTSTRYVNLVGVTATGFTARVRELDGTQSGNLAGTLQWSAFPATAT